MHVILRRERCDERIILGCGNESIHLVVVEMLCPHSGISAKGNANLEEAGAWLETPGQRDGRGI